MSKDTFGRGSNAPKESVSSHQHEKNMESVNPIIQDIRPDFQTLNPQEK
jgi:hypothetical protein